MPKMIPVSRELIPRARNSIKMLPPVAASIALSSVSLNFIIALNKMITTPSFTIPSPNTTENSLGYLIGSKSEIAAIVSVEHSKEHIIRISMIDNLRIDTSPVPPFVM